MNTPYVISSVRESDSAVRVEIVAPSGEVKRHRLTVKLWESLSHTRGDVISAAEYERIREYSERCEAVTKALRLLSDGMYSIRALTEKLTRSGFSKESAEAAMAVALKRGLIDEEAQAEIIAEKQASRRHRGRGRVVRELVAKGYPADVAKRGADSVPQSVYEEALEVSLMKKCRGTVPEDKAERDRLTASLVRLGFSAGEVIKEMNKLK